MSSQSERCALTNAARLPAAAREPQARDRSGVCAKPGTGNIGSHSPGYTPLFRVESSEPSAGRAAASPDGQSGCRQPAGNGAPDLRSRWRGRQAPGTARKPPVHRLEPHGWRQRTGAFARFGGHGMAAGRGCAGTRAAPAQSLSPPQSGRGPPHMRTRCPSAHRQRRCKHGPPCRSGFYGAFRVPMETPAKGPQPLCPVRFREPFGSDADRPPRLARIAGGGVAFRRDPRTTQGISRRQCLRAP